MSGAECGGPDLRVGSRRRPVRIRRSGRFRFVKRRGAFVFRLRGRFASRNRADVKFRYRREPRRAGGRRHCDDTGRWRLSPRRIYRIPFRNCGTHKAHTVLRTATGRVFWQAQWDDNDGWMTIAYACLFSANKRVRLHQDEDDDSDLSLFRLAGPYVAYAWHPCAEGCQGEDVEVKDLRDGRVARHAGYGAGGHDGAVSDLELKPNASVGVIALGDPYAPRLVPEVWAYDTLGARPLDRGNISRSSLELNGSTLSWLKDGFPHSAALR